jgi:putative solute:sodium symporter small subunit
MDGKPEKSMGKSDHNKVNYLGSKVNIFAPSTPFMREHLKIIWMMFVAWIIIVFGPVTATFVIPEIMTGITFLGFPLHYFLTAVGAPLGALILSVIYARKRDQLDIKYEVYHSSEPEIKADANTNKGEDK